MQFEQRRFLAVADVAEALASTPATVAQLLESGELNGIRVDGAWRVDQAEVQSWIDRELEVERRKALWNEAQSASITDLFGGR